MASSDALHLIGDKLLHQPANHGLLAYCPSMDLLALGSNDQQVLIYRLNGQRVYGATVKAGSLKVEKVQWKPNGQLLAIAWSDGVVRLLGADSSKIVHQISTADATLKPITCLGWGSTYPYPLPFDLTPDSQLLNEFGVHAPFSSADGKALNLPRALALIDVESSMPKLSPLPAGGTAEDIFSSRASLDALFQPFDPQDDDRVDVLVAGTEDGRIHLSIFDSFVIGSFEGPYVSDATNPISPTLLFHASHPHYSTHALLLWSEDAGWNFAPLDLRFVSASSEYLSLLASRSTALNNLLRYINQVQLLMVDEWNAARDLPSKFLRNINEDLAKHNSNIVQSLYHTVATGHTTPAVKEWLVDELAERGHKRWDKAVTSSLENLRKLVHQHMLPALERCLVILSRLAGIAKYQSMNDGVGFSSYQIRMVMDTVGCLNLLSSRVLLYVVDELDRFAAFSSWLRFEIDRQASEASTPSDDEIEKEALIDHSKVLSYIQTSLMSNQLTPFFDDSANKGDHGPWATTAPEVPAFDILAKKLSSHSQNQELVKGIPAIDTVCKKLERLARAVFEQIAEAEKRNVLFGEPVPLNMLDRKRPVALWVSPKDQMHCSSLVATAPPTTPGSVETGGVYPAGSCLVHVFHFGMRIENGVSSMLLKQRAALLLGEGEVVDLAFLDDDRLLVLWSPSGESSMLLSIPYKPSDDMSYISYDPDQQEDGSSTKAFSNPEVREKFAIFDFSEEKEFVPGKLEVSVRDGKGGECTRLCVLSRDGLRYKVFEMRDGKRATKLGDEDVTMSQ